MELSSLANKQLVLARKALAIERNYDFARLTRASSTPVRHKCFVSYHSADIDAVTKFVDDFADVFIPRVVGASDSDNFKNPVNSTDLDYVMRTIREKYLRNSTVTIVFVGKCTSTRKFVDWEIASTLRNDSTNPRGGLLGVTPLDKKTFTLPARLRANIVSGEPAESYASYEWYPASMEALRLAIETAFVARSTKSAKVENSLPLRERDSPC
jgi:MTH538 TIR-like domain (DUF1863)